MATRLTAGFILLPLLYSLLTSSDPGSKKIKSFILFISPIIISFIGLGIFNYVRFQNPFDFGYSSNQVGTYLSSLRSHGVFSFSHIPRNFYYSFISPLLFLTNSHGNLIFPFVTYNPAGLSFFISSPFFLYSLKSLLYKKTEIRLLWVTIFLTLFILLTYYTTWWIQFGTRFFSDFFPILFLLTLYSLRSKLSTTGQVIILFSSVLNIYLLASGFLLFKI